MQQQTYIRASFTPMTHDEEKGNQPDPDNAIGATIVSFLDTETGYVAIFIDEKGQLRHGYISQFSNCVFVTH